MSEDLYKILHCPNCHFIARVDKKQAEGAPGWTCPECGAKNRLGR